ncbi:flagellar type III secretion system protein FlhB [Pacificimonas sp. WHA3]|uniref:Flagellar type III secretion system protein FlhB n=1 Tax=Pacificimonas pallii TaxID=2827236 RepID=A0ABS6SF40_9SPHN|nr:EscU/YscU/HrcU family type III secretion system export apparatus switch protein [Pacificimonas pallii]MBV7256990.1 flagellar type III secretion system protein FlhB [Pacificimonas pallii]
MSGDSDPDQKTEEPTFKRKEKAAKDGDILKSRELLVATVSLGGCAYLVLMGYSFFTSLMDLLAAGLTLGPNDARDFQPGMRAVGMLEGLSMSMLGLFGVCMVAAVAGQAVLGKIQFNIRSARFQGGKLSLFKGLKRMFGMNALSELGKSILKVLLTGSMGVGFLLLWVDQIGTLGKYTLGGALGLTGGILALLLMILCAGLGIVALVDVPIQHMQRMKKLRMTKQEIKDEHKQSEGSPEVKAAMRARQRAAAKGGVRQGVGEANMILTNPTHFSVALRYDPAKDAAPMVVAAGTGDIALAIREVAAEMGKPVLSYPQLTRAIYFTSKVGEAVRGDLFVAVAVVLAFVLDVDRKMAADKPSVVVPPQVRFDANGQIPKKHRGRA